jgi:heme exporter protein D
MNGSEFNWSEFFAMGGYATFVWSSYALTAVVLIANIIMPLRQRRQVIGRIRRAMRREQQQTPPTSLQE